MAGKKILIAEDEKPLASALKLKLAGAGYEPTVVYNGDEALAALTEGNFSLMLVDIMMPKRDGFSVLEELKKGGNKMPVIVMSNLGQDEDMKHAKSLGAVDYVVKSNTPLAQIVERIQKQLGK